MKGNMERKEGGGGERKLTPLLILGISNRRVTMKCFHFDIHSVEDCNHIIKLHGSGTEQAS